MAYERKTIDTWELQLNYGYGWEYTLTEWNNEDGPIARITVCIAGSGLAEDETVIDTNNCPWAMEFIKQHGFGQATGRMVKSGYCTYPVVKLDIEKIGEYLKVA